MKKIILKIVVSFLLLIPIYCNAKKITCSNAEYNAIVEIDKEKVGIDGKIFISIKSDYTYEASFNTLDKDIIEISNEGIIRGLKEGIANVNAKINFIKDNQIQSACEVKLPIEIVSNDSSLKSLTIEEIDISTMFQPNKMVYEIKLPYKYDKINILAQANNSNAKITGDGRRYLNDGKNEYEVIVTATDGSSSTYKIIINREEANSDATLKKLIVEGYVLTPKFNKDTKQYSLSVDKEVENITINAIPNYEFAKVKGVGTFVLASGKNIYEIAVTAENGTEQKYEIVVNKSNGTSRLKSLSITGFDLNQKFESDVFSYKVTVNNEVTKLDIQAEAFDNDNVEIIGNENFQDGENTVFIKVTGKDKTNTTYKIIVNRLAKSTSVSKENSTLVKILLIIFIVSIGIMALLISIFVKRNYQRKKPIKKLTKTNKRKKLKK